MSAKATIVVIVMLAPGAVAAQPLVSEDFENTSYAGRGWYDTSGGAISTAEHISGSASYECRFPPGATGCSGGSPGRHLFTPTDSVYLSYHVKHSSSWAGSGKAYHPHMFHFLTDQNDAYVGPSYTHLTAYIEENEGYPALLIQDGQNIDETKIGINLIGVTESRSVAGCNGVATNIGYASVSCYVAGGSHQNGVAWHGPTPVFFDSAAKTAWHHVEAYFKLNTVSGGVGQADGIVRYWYDGQPVIDHSNVILRTGKYPTMKFNQFLVALYIGDGSPVDQTVWIDQLTIATSRPTTTPDAALPKLDAAPKPDTAPPKKDGAPPKKDGAPLRDGAIVKDTSGDATQLQDSPAPPRDSASGEGKARLSGGCGDCGVSGLPDGDCHGVGLLIAGLLWACRSRGRKSA
jgi:hypothetical protein